MRLLFNLCHDVDYFFNICIKEGFIDIDLSKYKFFMDSNRVSSLYYHAKQSWRYSKGNNSRPFESGYRKCETLARVLSLTLAHANCNNETIQTIEKLASEEEKRTEIR